MTPAPGTRRVFGVGAMVTGSGISSDGLDARRRRLLFRAWHRGIREMDLVLGRFADAQIAALSAIQLDEVEGWLDIPDQQIFAWVSGQEPPPAEIDTPLFRRLREFRGESSN
jgi:antitoxin CptB